MSDLHSAESRHRVCNAGFTTESDSYWYRGVVQYNGGPPSGYVWATSETAAPSYVWVGFENFRDDPEADHHWVERRPMKCWERVDV